MGAGDNFLSGVAALLVTDSAKPLKVEHLRQKKVTGTRLDPRKSSLDFPVKELLIAAPLGEGKRVRFIDDQDVLPPSGIDDHLAFGCVYDALGSGERQILT